MKQILVILLSFYFIDLAAQPAVVKAVHDGDSFKVKYDDGRIKWIRLWGVDAPEVISNKINARQPYGKESGDHVRKLIKGKRVQVDSIRTDLYGRTVAKVKLDTIDLTTYLISTGNAWWFNNSKIRTNELDSLKVLQDSAQVNKLGLWGLPGRKLRPSSWRALNTN